MTPPRDPRKHPKIERGVSPFSGVFSQWYGWAGVPHYKDSPEEGDSGSTAYKPYLEGPIRLFKWRARLDALKLERRLRKR